MKLKVKVKNCSECPELLSIACFDECLAMGLDKPRTCKLEPNIDLSLMDSTDKLKNENKRLRKLLSKRNKEIKRLNVIIEHFKENLEDLINDKHTTYSIVM
jgi:predicted transcriptional regulator